MSCGCGSLCILGKRAVGYGRVWFGSSAVVATSRNGQQVSSLRGLHHSFFSLPLCTAAALSEG